MIEVWSKRFNKYIFLTNNKSSKKKHPSFKKFDRRFPKYVYLHNSNILDFVDLGVFGELVFERVHRLL